LAKINLQDPERPTAFYNIQELGKSIIQFEVEALDNDVLSLSKNGLFKQNRKNKIYNIQAKGLGISLMFDKAR
jgi:hypothetical protein